MSKKDFGPAEVDNIEANGGAKSQGGTSGNAINGVSERNKRAEEYKELACQFFGCPKRYD
jgi:hypothetical protein